MRILITRTGLASLFLAIMAISVSFIIACHNNTISVNPPRAVKGVLDLSNWDLIKDGPIGLTGEWEFYWNQHLTPEDFAGPAPPARTGLVNLPGCWNDYEVEGRRISGDGYATYRLLVRLQGQNANLGLGLLDIGTAFTAYVNGEKVGGAGIAGIDPEGTAPDFSRTISPFSLEGNRAEIIIQVSNYHHRLGGPWEVIQFGGYDQILESREHRLALDLFLCGSILMIGLYHLCLNFLRKKDKSLLYFSVFCLLIAIRLLATGDRYMAHLFPGMPWELIVKSEYLSFYLAVPLFAAFSHSLFKQEISIVFLRTVQLLAVLFSGIVLLTPARFYSHTVQSYQLITLISCIYGFYVLILSLWRKREGAVLFTLGFIILFLTVVNDIGYSRMIIQTGYLAPLGIFVFIFFQTFILSQRYSMAFNTIETQSLELSESNKALWQEINERRRVQNALQEAYSIINRSPAVAFLWKNLEGWPVEFVSENVIDLFGYARDEFMSGRVSYAQTIHPDDLERVAQEVKTHSQETGSSVVVHEPYRIISRDGNVRWLDDRTQIRRDAEGHISHYEGIVVDITDSVAAAEALRDSEEKLARSRKMESLGLLAGGVAHDLNNVLTGIVSYPDLLMLKMPVDSKYREYLEAIKSSGDRAVAIVQDLITVARGVATAIKPLNLNDIIDDYLISPEHRQLGRYHPEVHIKTQLEKDLFNIRGSEVHIRKVVMNLVTNAAEAITGRGNVTISTANRYIDTPLKGYENVKVGEYVVLSISDDGTGISPDDLERVFEPFYTKKVMGRSGTGLGLTVVWNIVQDLNGYLDLTSNANGTTFDLFFPITREKISRADLAVPFSELQGAGENILVVDDEENQRDISSKMLDSFGYRTSSVSSGEEALEYLKDHTADLIVLDMIMSPGMNGRETYESIIKIRPDQKAIIVSGFAETDDVKRAQEMGAGKFLRKPLTLERIGLAVKEEIAKDKPSQPETITHKN